MLKRRKNNRKLNLKVYFLQQVKNEIEHIKKVATPLELSRLSFDKFNHRNYATCIYGLMTGDCSSDRAREITPKSLCFLTSSTDFELENINPSLNTCTTLATHLEQYLFLCGEDKHKEIIDYLTNKTQTLELKL